MTRKIIYLASPYGFSKQCKKNLLPEFIAALEDLGAEVWEPFSRNAQYENLQPGWAHDIALADLRDVRNSDGILAVVNGTPPDEGVMIELGAAIALGKPTFLFRDDFRRCSDSEEYPLNLMLFAGLPSIGWNDYFYTSIEELSDPKKSLAIWLKD
ncbi:MULTISPECIES: nucleoside 2-deoxyribosyltransferase [Prochlorococcus]|uniref:Nucleoside 2-deoxyribosyltransferase n=1 Tax=Prochlorococcus marinus (strain SARG / CCMP1375 / SS120) TaxID=167539 RepID=Q7VB88_PROMA|nr:MULTISPECIES: nucleoside 2-deoxyribosyltransferase [Prochlorococcus]AAQ00255.1 Nucleoside 2-deoxyribosyltransferase [Prochlorococcus marinus subsp. marinus str. CCMP1375]KGG14060.1 Nucleoside 2-deoxyribosyltransferase [Prochlorococcus marinus str. LG]KGG19193.1 Nucleoside 2-deoxyribosyltransferase [Prochlorococcus marinus str. SS2]KGG25172.1 Nucleoside 2-deoxyribosyltransferase [Prochlorococcus marinus str. SS35]KGG32498.1 Nucleoside 2-deoxyribosyltransferase [Prochlorococcus marinus str. S